MMIFFTGCKSGKYYLQEKTQIQVQEAFYEITPSAIKEGNSFAKITFVLSNPEVLKEIEIRGVYFKNQFAKFVSKDSTTFVASIILPNEENLNEKSIPFKLKSGEIIIFYIEKKKEKFVLFEAKNKDSLNSNMIPR